LHFVITLSQQAVTNEGTVITDPQVFAYKALPADITAMQLSASYFPVDGEITCQAGTGFVSSAALAPVYTLGTGILANASADGKVYVSEIDGTWHRAFETDAGFEIGFLNGPVTTNDGTYNYTTVWQTPLVGTNSVYMSSWQPVGLLSSFSYTNYKIILSDAADDAVFQAATNITFGDDLTQAMRIRGNTTNTFITVDQTDVNNFMTAMTVFMFASDFSYYDRYDITSNGDLYNAVYFRDINGIHYLIGTNSSIIEAYQILASDGGVISGDEGSTGDVTIRCWGYSLDGHDFYVLRLGESDTLVFDPTTNQWADWVSPNRTNWRAHVGGNWVGMSADTLARGFGSDVVAGDDVTGTLWVLDPTAGRDDRTDSSSDPFDRVVTGGVQLTGRDTVPCGAVTIDLALGNPSQSGATITLAISDDLGNNWVSCGAQIVAADDFGSTVEWRSLGTMKAPGRVFRLTDNGATVRIGGANLR
jgi:hypothetical protein